MPQRCFHFLWIQKTLKALSNLWMRRSGNAGCAPLIACAGSRILGGLIFLSAMIPTAPAQEQENAFDPAGLDLAKLIECRAEVADYNELGAWLQSEPAAPNKLGWRKVESGNPFLEQYHMDKPVSVFGSETSDIAFAGSGVVALLDGKDASSLAGKLEVDPLVDTSDKFMGQRVISEKTEVHEALKLTTRISLNVSTVESHPGKVLVGCSYNFKLDMQE